MALFLLASSVCLCGQAQQHPRDGEIHDADTKAWWHTTEALSGDDMEGRDTGSAAYQRAANYVAARFKAAGLKPAGDGGGYFQSVSMHEVDVLPRATFDVERDNGKHLPLTFLQQITVGAADDYLYEASGAMTFRGYCGKDAMKDIEGKIVVCFGTQRQGLPTGAERTNIARNGGARGLVNVDDPYFTIEPPRWPYAYARSVTLNEPGGVRIPRGSRSPWPMLPPMRMSAEAFAKLLEGTGQDADAILKAGGAKQPLASFDIPAKLTAHLDVNERDISSPNVLAILPGSDPKLRDEYVVIAAHLDGYGFGTPVAGDKLYNGTLDDAAYVALLIQMADDIKAARLAAPKRSILFCAFTGEEKGLLGSTWFTEHPTLPVEKLVADVNLDQLRPLFPLHILTAIAINETTLGETARKVGAPMKIELRADAEPERGLLRRADQYPFLRIHVPAISFVFGYDPGTDAERRYREWYQVRYHRPQDDVTQPVDFDAAASFDNFFYKLVETIADAPERPAFLPGSQFAAKK
jgi:Peptidase family M28